MITDRAVEISQINRKLTRILGTVGVGVDDDEGDGDGDDDRCSVVVDVSRG